MASDGLQKVLRVKFEKLTQKIRNANFIIRNVHIPPLCIVNKDTKFHVTKFHVNAVNLTGISADIGCAHGLTENQMAD